MIFQKLFGFDRSAHMRELHKSGRYAGTSRIGEWNRSDEKRTHMSELRSKNSMDKTSKGYGSEYHMRQANRLLLHNKFQGNTGYLYYLEFPATVKVGFSKDYQKRTSYLGGKVLMIITGPTDQLADLEFDTFIQFMNYTKLNDEGTRYTEFLDKCVKDDVNKFLIDRINSSNELSIVQ